MDFLFFKTSAKFFPVVMLTEFRFKALCAPVVLDHQMGCPNCSHGVAREAALPYILCVFLLVQFFGKWQHFLFAFSNKLYKQA